MAGLGTIDPEASLMQSMKIMCKTIACVSGLFPISPFPTDKFLLLKHLRLSSSGPFFLCSNQSTDEAFEGISNDMASNPAFPTIKHVRSFIIDGVGSGGDYHNVRLQLRDLIKAIGADAGMDYR